MRDRSVSQFRMCTIRSRCYDAPISCSIDGGKCNSEEESADCIRPLFEFTDEFTSFVLIKQIANYWNDSSLYLSFADRRFSDYLMITRQRVGSNIERQRE